MSEITFVGTGEAFDPALPNTSLLYRGSRAVLFDCGYSIPHAFWRLTRDPSLLDAIYVTHLHADHSFGLPPLLLWMREAGRSRPLEVIGGPGVAGWLKKLLELGYPGSYSPERCYPIEPREVSPDRPLELGGMRLITAESEHSVRNLSVRVDDQGKSFCYSGDGAPNAATEALYRGAGVLVHECYSAGHPVAGHARIDEVLLLAERCGVKTLCLLHIRRSDKEAVRAIFRERTAPTPNVLLPSPGDIVPLAR